MLVWLEIFWGERFEIYFVEVLSLESEQAALPLPGSSPKPRAPALGVP